MLQRPKEIQVGFENEEKAQSPGSHGQGQLFPHGHFTSSKDARWSFQAHQPWPRGTTGLWRGPLYNIVKFV